MVIITVNIEMNREYYEHIFENKLRYPHHLYNESYLKGSDDSEKIIIQINMNDFKGEMKEGIKYIYYQTKE